MFSDVRYSGLSNRPCARWRFRRRGMMGNCEGRHSHGYRPHSDEVVFRRVLIAILSMPLMIRAPRSSTWRILGDQLNQRLDCVTGSQISNVRNARRQTLRRTWCACVGDVGEIGDEAERTGPASELQVIWYSPSISQSLYRRCPRGRRGCWSRALGSAGAAGDSPPAAGRRSRVFPCARGPTPERINW